MAEKANPPPLADPMAGDYSGFGESYGLQAAPEAHMTNWRPTAGAITDRATADIITAQQVGVKRNVARVMQECKSMAFAMGEAYIYRWPVKVKDKKTGEKRTEYVEGPTIKLANDLARLYGNCRVDVDLREGPTHFLYAARFSDYETGYQQTRLFRQRKGQDTGMRDQGRAEDIIFQIGQSKAIRNVVVNVLSSFKDEMMSAAKSGLRQRIAKKPEDARNWIRGQFEELGVALGRVERIVGRTADKWSVPDMAKLYSEINAIADGMADPDDLYPIEEEAAEGLADAREREDEGEAQPEQPKQPTKPKSGGKKPTKTRAKKPAAEPEPEPSDEGEAEQQPSEPATAEAQADEPSTATEPEPPAESSSDDIDDDLSDDDEDVNFGG